MKKVKYMPIFDEIEQYEIIDNLLEKIKNDRRLKIPYHADKIYLNRTTLTIIVQYLGDIIKWYLADDVVGYKRKTIIKPFPWLRFFIYNEPDKKTINNLTGKEYNQKGRRRFKAIIPVYYQRKWNKLD